MLRVARSENADVPEESGAQNSVYVVAGVVGTAGILERLLLNLHSPVCCIAFTNIRWQKTIGHNLKRHIRETYFERCIKNNDGPYI